MPTSPPAVRTSSKVRGSLRAGLAARESQTSEPAASRPIMPPGLGQCTVATVPSASSNVGEEALVAPDQPGGEEGLAEAHGGP